MPPVTKAHKKRPPAPPSPPGATQHDITMQTQPAKRLRQWFGVRWTQQGLLFVQPPQCIKRMCVSGDFNHWSDRKDMLWYDPILGVWYRCVTVPPRTYRYQLLVDGSPRVDAYNMLIETKPGEMTVNVIHPPDDR